jgi:hypothetical protein
MRVDAVDLPEAVPRELRLQVLDHLAETGAALGLDDRIHVASVVGPGPTDVIVAASRVSLVPHRQVRLDGCGDVVHFSYSFRWVGDGHHRSCLLLVKRFGLVDARKRTRIRASRIVRVLVMVRSCSRRQGRRIVDGPESDAECFGQATPRSRSEIEPLRLGASADSPRGWGSVEAGRERAPGRRVYSGMSATLCVSPRGPVRRA